MVNAKHHATWRWLLAALPVASGTAAWWQPAVAPANTDGHLALRGTRRQRLPSPQPTPPAEAEEVETPHHEEDAARLEELLQVTISPPGYPRLPRLPKAAERVLIPPTAVDVVISGGALRGYFMLGARHAIESRADLVVQRYSGTSAGAWTAMFMATDLSSANWLRTYTLTAAVARKAATRGRAAPALMEAYRENLWPWLQTVLPADAHEKCSGRLFVTITTLDQRGLQKLTVSQFDSNQDLFEACAASSCVPMVTTKRFGARFRGKRSFDGLFSGDNIPLFTDHARPQLVFDLGKVQYSLSALVQATDPCIEALAVSGALQTERFLSGRRGDPRTEVLSWKGWRGPAYPKHWREDRGPLAPLSRVGRQLQQGLQPLTRRLQAPPPDGRSRLDVFEDPVGQ